MSEFLTVLLTAYFVGLVLGPWLALLVPLGFVLLIAWVGWLAFGPLPLFFLVLGFCLYRVAQPGPAHHRTATGGAAPAPRPRLGHA
jgi:hypothetical protein